MPNLEIFGLNEKDIPTIAGIKNVVRCNLEASELKNVVFTCHEAKVTDIDGKEAPFIRITDTNKKRADRIAELFGCIIDVEIMILHKFTSREEELKKI